MTTCAMYLRQSLDRTGEGAAVDRQEKECRELAERNGWTIAKTYKDNDTSATSGPRPGFDALIDDLEAGRHDVVLAWHTDRLYRRLRDLVPLVEVAEKRAIRIAAVKAGDVDLSTPSGRMVAGMLGSAARYEVEQKSARQRAANRQRATQGAASWTRRPFGFDRVGDKVVILEHEAAAIRTAVDLLLGGQSLASIGRHLDAQEIRTSTGGTWTPTTLRRVLTNPRLVGRVIYNGEDMGALAPSILDEETFERVVGILTDPGRRRAPSTQVKHLMSGVLVCSDCQVPMMSGRSGSVPAYRCRCGRARRSDHVDKAIEKIMVSFLSQPNAATLLAPATVDVTAERAKVVELRHRRDAIAAMVADGLLGPDAAREQATRLADQISRIEGDVRAATEDDPAAPFVSADDVEAAWKAASLLDKRSVIKALIRVECLPIGKGTRIGAEDERTDLDVTWKRGASA